MWILFALLAPLVHEFGHWLAALLCGSRIHFCFQWGRLGPLPVPRWVWYWPVVSRGKLRTICHAGFALELVLVPFMPWAYQAAAIAHYVAYPWYAGESNDWKGVV